VIQGPGHERGWLPSVIERKRYFPEIDMSYVPLAPEPEGEADDRDVIPRAIRMSRVRRQRRDGWIDVCMCVWMDG